MFIREITKKSTKGGKIYSYTYQRLVESFRTPHGPRQRTVLELGTLTVSKDKHKVLANMIEAILTKQDTLFDDDPELTGLATHYANIVLQNRLTLVQCHSDEEPEKLVQFETIDAQSATLANCRTIGPEYIALSQLKELKIFEILTDLGLDEQSRKYAVAQIVSRMVHPSSERETARWLRESSALDELLETDFSKISDFTLHRISDIMLKNKDGLEKRLSEVSRSLYSLKETVLLYDLTNTYFESPKSESELAQYGHSKEKRQDCPLVTLALVVDGLGFPKKSRIYKGNVSEPGTLIDFLDQLFKEEGLNEPRTIVIDAGFATEKNLKILREDPRYDYVAISRGKKSYRDLFTNTEVRTIKMSKKELSVRIERMDEEAFLLCTSSDRTMKDEAIFARRRQKFEAGLVALAEGLRKPRARKKHDSIVERIGRLKERYKIGNFYTIEVSGEGGIATDLNWTFHGSKNRDHGEYLIRTNRLDLEDHEISFIHRTLTMIEATFRFLKSDLGLRPNFHQRDRRMAGHIFISVLAYFGLAPILNKLNWGGSVLSFSEVPKNHPDWELPYGWRGVLAQMASQVRATNSFLCKDNRRLDIRMTSEPNPVQVQVYKSLALTPKPLKKVIRKEKPPQTP